MTPQPPPSCHLGEIHTGILQTSAAITAQTACEVLAFIPGRPLQTWERPIRHVASPEMLTGIDLSLPSAAGSRRRGVGTIATRTFITAGRIVQACTRTAVCASRNNRRRQWSYYLARPAWTDVIGRFTVDDLAEGFLTGSSTGFDLAGVCANWLGRVQQAEGLDRRAPLTARRSRLRWVATSITSGEQGQALLRADDDLRTLRLHVPGPLLAAVPELCRDLALHDWLVTSAINAVDRAGIGRRDRADVVQRLGPLIDHLLHLWMPAARLSDGLTPYWEELDRRSGLGRQWEALVQQVRDQVALAGITHAQALDLSDRSRSRVDGRRHER
jgi:hypothetical protein